jgi:uncharacterized protein (DUF2141 family)
MLTAARMFHTAGCGGLALLLSAPLSAADVTVEVRGLRSQNGDVLVAVCTAASFLGRDCPYAGSAPAAEGTVVVPGVPEGVYAVQAIHDENGNGELDRSGLLPDEGMGFSRDAPMRRGPPRFGDAAFELSAPGARIVLTMRYFK